MITDEGPALDQQIDELYWCLDRTVSDVADELGLPARSLHRLVTPLDAGATCYRCAGELAYHSRAELDGRWLRCPACRTSRCNPRWLARWPIARPTPVGGTIIVREQHDIGVPIEACVEALARAGLAWDERSLLVVGAGDAVIEELHEWAPGTLAVRSLADLGASQCERLQALFVLTRMRWRVVSAEDIRGHDRCDVLTADVLDDLDDAWWPSDPRSPSWAEHLVESTRAWR